MKIPAAVHVALLAFLPLMVAPASLATLATAQDGAAVLTESALERLDERIRAAEVKIRPAVAALLDFDHVTGKWDDSGSATVVSADGLVVTAAHCLGEPGDEVQLRLGNGQEVTATTLGMDLTLDFGLMRIQGDGPFDYAGIQANTTEIGPAQALLMYGFPGDREDGRGAVMRLGAFLGVRADGMLCTECKMMPGDSGGGLFTLDGRLVGINSEIEQDEDRNFHVPMDEMMACWGDLVKGEVFGDLEDQFDADFGWYQRATVVAPPAPSAEEAERLVGQVLPGGIDGLGDDLERRLGEKARRSTVRISSRREGKVLYSQGVVLWGDRGTARGYSGLVVSKSSRVTGDTLRCLLHDGTLSAVNVLGRDPESDLVVMGIAVRPGYAKGALEGASDPAVGSLVAVTPVEPAKQGARPSTIGGVIGASLHGAKRRNWGMLGIRVSVGMDEPPRVAWAVRRGVARKAGVKRGDIVVAVAGEETPTRARMLEVLHATEPGQTVDLTVMRKGEQLEFEVTLGGRSKNKGRGAHVAYLTDVSARRGGFAKVLRHDVSLTPEQCGGPVFDVKGRILGLTLARVDRTGCVVMPYGEILGAVDRVLDQVGNPGHKGER